MTRSDQPTRDQRPPWKLLIIPALIVAGLVAGAVSPWGAGDLLAAGRALSDQPWYPPLVILAMAVLFTFGLPGSLSLWLLAPFFTPWLATLFLLIGSLGGALGAYGLGSRLRSGWQPGDFGQRVMELLDQRGDVITQTALRVLPGFPHSVINFAGGLLGLRLPAFVAAVIIGLGIKWGVYASAVHGATRALEAEEAINPAQVAPLLILAILLLGGGWARHRVASGKTGGGRGKPSRK